MRNIPIGQLLLEDGSITQEQLNEALEYKNTHTDMRVGEILETLGFITGEERLHALSRRLNVPIFQGNEIAPLHEVANLVPEDIARKYEVMPIAIEDNALQLAMHDPLNLFAVEDIKATCGFPIVEVLADRKLILASINKYYSASNVHDALSAMREEYKDYSFDDRETKGQYRDEFADVTARVENAPLVKFINNLIHQAYERGASDIHIEPFGDDVVIRMRVDGVLSDFMHLDKKIQYPLTTRFKIMGDMNIAESRIPQDGRINLRVEETELDIRLSTIPTIYGEKIVVRLLGHNLQKLTELTDIGLNGIQLNQIKQLVHKPYGIVLLTGPTGSGKTTSLYAMLNEVNTESVNIITVEDPVEKRIKGINQVQVNAKAGLTFASGLRSILRQDPDIIMLGEIRDEETAEIAVRAAITGHLVLSTIHTNDTATAVARLRDMGVEPYLISSSLVGIIAQRLTRRLCEDCKEAGYPTDKGIKMLSGYKGKIYRAVGCEKCNYLGYKGRVAIFEIMQLDTKLREMITSNTSAEEMKRYALDHGMTTLLQSMQELVKEGITTIDELVRIVYNA
ncbi:MAG: Flp pilus assembly complex ATPase component TadA [Erysipelotrichales bacterium]|nr:Flp pilus assembly complex ATPase component TadA [Erysipelotrichales bacterium]